VNTVPATTTATFWFTEQRLLHTRLQTCRDVGGSVANSALFTHQQAHLVPSFHEARSQRGVTEEYDTQWKERAVHIGKE
jgi:hypothetical protein